jgi:hypothetical protein
MLSITINITWRTIMGALFVGVAVAISSLGIGRAEHVTPDKKTTVYNCSTGTACLTGNSSGSKTWGIYAEGTSNDALHAITSTTSGNSAVAGISTGTSGNGHGVFGNSSNGDGVYGTSSSANGVYGFTGAGARNLAGVFGESDRGFGPGVYGYSGSSTGSIGVIGEAKGGNYEQGATAVYAISDGSPDIFAGYDVKYLRHCTIDPNANLTCSGKVSGGAMLTRQRSNAGRRVLTYAAQAATPTIEDLGAAQMHDGIANVEIPADFASVIDRGNPYYVFLMPMGDTRGLYVSMQNAAGFQVHENMHGRSNVTSSTGSSECRSARKISGYRLRRS